jgi:hypothetical protein
MNKPMIIVESKAGRSAAFRGSQGVCSICFLGGDEFIRRCSSFINSKDES